MLERSVFIREEETGELAKELNSKILKLYGKFLSEDGSEVDYSGMKNSPEFEDFVANTKSTWISPFIHQKSTTQHSWYRTYSP